ncbi:MAG: hypothetical protein WCB19_05685 [Thermoplasmata archaeon]
MHPVLVVAVGVAGLVLTVFLGVYVGLWTAVGAGLLTVAAEVLVFTRHPATAATAVTVAALGAVLVYAGVT